MDADMPLDDGVSVGEEEKDPLATKETPAQESKVHHGWC